MKIQLFTVAGENRNGSIYAKKRGGALRIRRIPRGGEERRARSPTGSNERSDGHVRANCTRQAAACFGNEPLSLSLSLIRTYVCIYEYESGRCGGEATLHASSFLSSDRFNPRPPFLFKLGAFGSNGFRSSRLNRSQGKIFKF